MTGPDLNTNRDYRRQVGAGGLIGFAVRIQQTDLWVRAGKDLTALAYDLVRDGRGQIEEYSRTRPEFLTSLNPLPPDPLAPPLVKEMLAAGRAAGVGPMAAVAGALAAHAGRGLKPHSPAGVVVENGGDAYLDSPRELTAALFAGAASKVSLKLGLKIAPEKMPAGLCTSSGTIGHSHSFGRADLATVLADSAALADAAATALGNRIQNAKDIEPALEWVAAIPGVRGGAVVLGDQVGFLGDLDLTSL